MQTTSARRRAAGIIAAAALILTSAFAVGPPATADEPWPWMDTSLSPDQRATLLLAEMTLEEKVDLMSGNQEFGTYAFYNAPIPRLGIPELAMQDSASGIHAHGWQTLNTGERATALPSAQALGATWSRETTRRYAEQVAAETLASDANVLLSPVGDMLRNPYWGRTNESPSEDPIMTADYLTDFTTVLQENGVMATLKHYLAYNQETNRSNGGNNIVTERALREVHALPYEAAIKDADAGSVMCAFNKVNGEYACENPHTLRGYLDTFGFTGFVGTDYGAAHTTLGSLNGGVDIETGDKDAYSEHLLEAVQNGSVPESRLDESCYRILFTMFRLGLFENPIEPGTIDVAEGSRIAQEVQEQAITLLKNDGALPLADDAQEIAVIGADADHIAIGGGTPFVLATEETTTLDGITARATDAGATVEWVAGNDQANGANMLEARDMTAVPSSVLSPTNRQGTGLDAQFWRAQDFQGAPDEQRIAPQVNYDVGILSTLDTPGPSQVAPPPVSCPTCPGSAVYEGWITPPATGTYQLSLTGLGDATLELDGQQVLVMDGAPGTLPVATTPDLSWVEGEAHQIRVTFNGNAPFEILNDGTVLLQWKTPPDAQSPEMQRAVDAAASSDVAIVYANTIEGEAHDRVSLKLPQSGDQLIEAVAAANPNTIVVLSSAGAVTMPWLDDVEAVVQTYFGGQQQGRALARVLWGDVNPSGKLTLSYPASEDALAPGVVAPYAGAGDVNVDYTEGVAVGYKGYQTAGVDTLFPFGYGLSYSSFDYSDLEVNAPAGRTSPIDVGFTVANTGTRDGDEAAQVYLDLPDSTGEPNRLVGYARVSTEAGSATEVDVQIDPTASTHPLGYFDEASDSWKIAPGQYTVLVGRSSEDLPLRATFTVEPEDTTAPTFELPGLTDGGLYGVGGTIDFGFTIDDPTATVASTLDGEPIDLSVPLELWRLALGQHTLVVTATDPAGNVTSETFRFYVKTSLRDLDILLRHFEETQVVQGRDVVQLRNILFRVRAAEARGDDRTALVHLERFRTVVERRITDEAASAALIRSVDAITVELGGTPPGADVTDRRNLRGLAVDPSQEDELLRD